MKITSSRMILGCRVFSLLIALFLCGCLQSGPLAGNFAPAGELEGDWSVLKLPDGTTSRISVAKLTNQNLFGISLLDDHKFYTAVFLTAKRIKGYLMVMAVDGKHVYALVQPETSTSWRMRFLTLRKDSMSLAAAALRAMSYGLSIKRSSLIFELGGKLDALNVSDLFDDPLFMLAIDFTGKEYSIKPGNFPPDRSPEMVAARSREFSRLLAEVNGQLNDVDKEIYEIDKKLERLRRQQ